MRQIGSFWGSAQRVSRQRYQRALDRFRAVPRVTISSIYCSRNPPPFVRSKALSIPCACTSPPSVGPARVFRNQVITPAPFSDLTCGFTVDLAFRLFRGHTIQSPGTRTTNGVPLGHLSPNFRHRSRNIPGITLHCWCTVKASQLKGTSHLRQTTRGHSRWSTTNHSPALKREQASALKDNSSSHVPSSNPRHHMSNMRRTR